jgi:hypothetical protein
MAKYYVFEETDEVVKLVDKIAEEYDLTNYVDFQVLGTEKGKEVVKVVRANDITESITEREDLVAVIVRTDAFDRVDEKTKEMWLRLEMDKVSYDSEKDKVCIGGQCVTVPIGMAERYGSEAIDAAKLGIYTLAQIADEKKNAGGGRKRKKKD